MVNLEVHSVVVVVREVARLHVKGVKGLAYDDAPGPRLLQNVFIESFVVFLSHVGQGVLENLSQVSVYFRSTVFYFLHLVY